MTANDLINSALRLINVLGSGETPSSSESQDAMFVLNAMIDGWQTERLLIFTIQRQILTPAVLKQTYTIGMPVNGLTPDFAVPRPPRIDRAGVVILSNPQQPLELPIEWLTDAQWQMIPVKGISANFPTKVWYDEQFPLGNLNYYPVPNVNLQFTLYSWTALNQFPDLHTNVLFPPGYQALLRYALAERLAIEFNRGVPPEIADLASRAKGRIKSLNAKPLDLRCDAALVSPKGGNYNWISDTSGRSRG